MTAPPCTGRYESSSAWQEITFGVGKCDCFYIEVMPEEFQKLLENREQIVAKLKEYGFTYVTMDLQGYRMGSMNETL